MKDLIQNKNISIFLLILLFFIIIILLILSFRIQNDKSNSDFWPNNLLSIEVGSFYGECRGVCFSLVKINSDNSIFILDSDSIKGSKLWYSHNIDDKFLKRTDAAEYTHLFSNENISKLLSLLEYTQTKFGIPDAYDQGGYYVRFRFDNQTSRTYLIDTDANAFQEQDIKSIHDLLSGF